MTAVARPSFLCLYRPPRADFGVTITDAERAVLGEHFAFLQAMMASGDLVLAGPTTDAAYGVMIFEADDPAAAQRFVEQDPAVRAGLFQPEVHGMNVALLRGR